MPTEPEWQALKDAYNAWDDTYKGLIVRNDAARETDPYIFLPAAGQIENNQSKLVGSSAYFWSSTFIGAIDFAFYAAFGSGGGWTTTTRAFGTQFSIRPVSD